MLKIKNKSLDTEPLISIIIPVKNEEENIEYCIKSCINITCHKNKEIIVVIMGVLNKTSNIIEKLREENPLTLRIIHLPINLGKKLLWRKSYKNC